MTELRQHARAWTRREIDVKDPEAFARALQAVMETRQTSVDEARALGFWSDDDSADNPPVDAQGQVEVPRWRHALINVPHPLLKRGLVVLDTPGLNAIGAEPELTVGLLPSAHVVVFVLGADTGVTRSDLAIWRDHLSSQSLTRYVVLNKIDAVHDPLSPPEVSEAQIAHQCAQVAQTLGVPGERVFPISARQALEARVEGNARLLMSSRLLALEQALAQQLLPQRRAVFEQLTLDALAVVQRQTASSLHDLQRHLTEQLLELRSLRGKNSSKVQVYLQRVAAETTEFELSTGQLQALRTVHTRMLKEALQGLSGEPLRKQIDQMMAAIRDSFLKLGAKRSFTQLFADLRQALDESARRSEDIRTMLVASFGKLNAEFGFALAAGPTPDLSRFRDDLTLIERNYVQYLGLSQAIRLSQPRFLEQFRRMLMSRLRVVFETAASEIELWNRTASAQVDGQLRERRRAFKRRHEALERIRTASSDLEVRLGELEQQEAHLAGLDARLNTLFDATRSTATQRDLGRSLPVLDNRVPSERLAPVPPMLLPVGVGEAALPSLPSGDAPDASRLAQA